MDEFMTKQRTGQIRAQEKIAEGDLLTLRFGNEVISRKGTLLSMYMGTGKSRVAIERILKCKEMADADKKTLVVVLACPVAMLPDPKALNPGGWLGEIRKWMPEPLPELYMSQKGTTLARAQELTAKCKQHTKEFEGIPLIVCQSYDSWRQPYLAKLGQAIFRTKRFFTLLVCDESHRCKAPNSATTKTMHSFAKLADRVLLLTGTPMPHSPLDLWSQAFMCDPGAYGASFYAFRNKYAIMRPMGQVNVVVGMKRELMPEFKKKMDIFTYSLSLEDALDLPPVLDTTIDIQLDGKERRQYDLMKKEMVAEIQKGIDMETISVPNVLAQINKLAQITGGSMKLEDGTVYAFGESKAKWLREFLENDLPLEAPCVIFCRYIADIEQVKKAALKVGRDVFELSGKRKELEEWRASKSGSVIVVQESAGGVGIDLTRASTVIYFSVNYSLGDFDQSFARVYRAGQTRPVTAIHLVATGTIDETIRDSIRHKRNVVKSVLEESGFDVEQHGLHIQDYGFDNWGDMFE